tara:strand:+ start:356 stop:478 length:123 start_codon:yes stop_codon:yes gene_type:complete
VKINKKYSKKAENNVFVKYFSAKMKNKDQKNRKERPKNEK